MAANRLIDVLKEIDQYDDDLTLYVRRPWTPASPTVVAAEQEDGGIPNIAVEIDASYFLEVFLTRQLIEDILKIKSIPISQLDICQRLIRYAELDA